MTDLSFKLNSKYKTFNDLLSAFGDWEFRLDIGCGYVKPEGYIGLDNLSGQRSQIPDEVNAPDIY